MTLTTTKTLMVPIDCLYDSYELDFEIEYDIDRDGDIKIQNIELSADAKNELFQLAIGNISEDVFNDAYEKVSETAYDDLADERQAYEEAKAEAEYEDMVLAKNENW